MSTETFEYHSDWTRSMEARGRVAGRAEDVLTVLDARAVPVSDAVRARVTECVDLDQLEVWLRRAATAGVAEDLFG